MSNETIANGGVATFTSSPSSIMQEQDVASSNSGSNSMESKEISPTQEQPDPQQLRESLKKQVEFYFTREKLASDAFLVSQMNSELFVPIAIIADFKLIKAMTTDMNTLVEALKESTQLTVDSTGTKVKPNFTVQRNTIVLRDIPPDVPQEDIKGIFYGDEKPTIKSANPDFGNTWFITFESEEETLNMLNFIRGKTFQGKPIAGRIKSENILKGFYKPDTNPNPSQATAATTNYTDLPQYSYYPNTQYLGSSEDITSYRPYKHGYQPKHQYTNDKYYHPNPRHYEKSEHPLRYPNSYRGKREYRKANNHGIPRTEQQEQHQLHQNHSWHHQNHPINHHRPHPHPKQHQPQQPQLNQKKVTKDTHEPSQAPQPINSHDAQYNPDKQSTSQLQGEEAEQEHNRLDKKLSKKPLSKSLHNNHQGKQERKKPQEVKKSRPTEKMESKRKPGSDQFPPLPSKSGSATPTQQDVKPYNSPIAISEIVKSLRPGDFKLANKKAESVKETSNGESDTGSQITSGKDKEGGSPRKQDSIQKESRGGGKQVKTQTPQNQPNSNKSETKHSNHSDEDRPRPENGEQIKLDELKNEAPSSSFSYAQALRQKQQKKEESKALLSAKVVDTKEISEKPVQETTGSTFGSADSIDD
ncbi:hypothetical protein K7432_011513 [Basidiobolus ranarum]|uniref:HTH La-type RNA-binding domain-containing protein n=1 Tax=Basidiobolus ranarum TaxID=34480 RepID=A0ABR2VTR5_9FUNG